MRKLVKLIVFFTVLGGFIQWRAGVAGVTPRAWLKQQVATVQLWANQAYTNINYALGNSDTKQTTTAKVATNASNLSTTSSASKVTWGKRSVKVYLDPKMSQYYRTVWLAALQAWNKTKAFHFIVVTKKSEAKVVLGTEASSSTSDAGITDKSWLVYGNKSVFTKATAKLNTYYLDEYSYTRQLNTAEHELGHVIGLNHDNKHRSVMQSSGSYYSIQKRDVAKVNKLYANLK